MNLSRKFTRLMVALPVLLALTGCGAIPAAALSPPGSVVKSYGRPSAAELDALEKRYFELRAERKNISEQLATMPPDDEKAAALGTRLNLVDQETREVAVKMEPSGLEAEDGRSATKWRMNRPVREREGYSLNADAKPIGSHEIQLVDVSRRSAYRDGGGTRLCLVEAD
jgi:hypothetical protein